MGGWVNSQQSVAELWVCWIEQHLKTEFSVFRPTFTQSIGKKGTICRYLYIPRTDWLNRWLAVLTCHHRHDVLVKPIDRPFAKLQFLLIYGKVSNIMFRSRGSTTSSKTWSKCIRKPTFLISYTFSASTLYCRKLKRSKVNQIWTLSKRLRVFSKPILLL